MRTIACLIALLGWVPVPAADGGQPQPDSLEVLERARAAQAEFERLRVRHLPWGWSIPRSPADEVVGRFVLLAEGDDSWESPPEPEPVALARAELIAALDRASGERAGDEWIVGTAVRYRIEAGRAEEALGALASCRAPEWWCKALRGWARHATGEFRAAEAAFDEALARMPSEERERWLDLEVLLDRESARAYRALGPGGRAAFARRLWWLADPLWSVPGNDRRSEHFARNVLDRLQEGARSPFGVAWGEDLREILLRYGWPAGWERERGSTGVLGAGGPNVVGRDPPAERRFLPPWPVFAGPSEVPPGGWSLDDEGARTTYAPAYSGARFIDLEHQLAVFRRGDSAVVVAAYDLSRDTLPADAAVEAALVVSAHPDAAPALGRARPDGPVGRLSLEAPGGPAVMSLEVREDGGGPRVDGRFAGRARYGLRLPPRSGGPALSDLLLLDGGSALPESLDGAARRARGSVRVSPGERLGLFWEVYPATREAREATFSMRLRDERGGFWRGLGAALGLVERARSETAVEWSEVVPPDALYPRSLAITLPELPAGDYALELVARFAGSSETRAVRPIVVGE